MHEIEIPIWDMVEFGLQQKHESRVYSFWINEKRVWIISAFFCQSISNTDNAHNYPASLVHHMLM